MDGGTDWLLPPEASLPARSEALSAPDTADSPAAADLVEKMVLLGRLPCADRPADACLADSAASDAAEDIVTCVAEDCHNL